MYTKAKKTISHVTPERQLTDEEKKMQVMKILATKREQYAVTILNGLCSNPEAVSMEVVVSGDGQQHTEINNGDALVDRAVKMADYLIEKLFPMKKEEGDED